MIKLFDLIPRLSSISSAEFHDHYRHPHGTLGTQIEVMRAYVQSHQMDSPLLGPAQGRFEAVAEGWFDTVADAMGFEDTPLYREHLDPDHSNFVDMDQLISIFTIEEVVISGPDPQAPSSLADRMLNGLHLSRPTTVKLLHFAAGDGAWDDGEAFARSLGAVRYVRCRPYPEAHSGEAPPFAEVHELWWPTASAFEHGAGDGANLRAKIADEASITLLAQAERFI